MVIITEHPDEPTTPPPQKSNPNPNPNPKSESNPNPFHFWFYFTLILSLITLLTLLFSSLTPQDPKAWFLNLPPILRHHYSNGRAIKVQTAPNHPQVEVFTIQRGPVDSGSRVLIVHGVGCSSFAFRDVVGILGRMGVYNVAIDLPGSGFSDKEVVVEEEVEVGGSRGLWEVYEEIKEKGVFWGFDQLVEQGYVDLEANGARVRTRERVKLVEMGGEEMGRVLGQVVDSMGLAPVDLVLHDSAFGLSANWIAENLGLVRSVTVLDGVPSGTALPIWALDVPLVREVVLGFRFVFERVLEKCCVKSVGSLEADAHRILLKGREGRRAVVGMGKNLNCSFDLSEWSGREGVKSLPIRVIWSAGWSDEWTAEGQRIADALPQAKLVTHSGRRWTQAYNAGEVAERIYDFISSLPGTPKQVTEEPIIEHVQKVFSEAETGDHHHHHHHDHGHGGHDHHVDHDHAHAGYADAYGLGHNWAM